VTPAKASRPVAAATANGPRKFSHFGKRRGLPATTSQPNVQAPEFETHCAILTLIKTIAPGVLVFHPANGGWRSKAEGARLKALGVTPGIPDLCLIAPVGKVFFIECKTASGKLSPDQRKIHEWLTAIGVQCAVCRSVDDALNALRCWGLAPHDPLAHLDPPTRLAWRRSAIAWRAERAETEGDNSG
jgi:hypothetical protein